MIYFIQENDFGAIKIGYTKKNPQKRLSELQVGNSNNLVLRYIIEDADMSVEKDLHKFLKRYKLRGEWFDYYGIHRYLASGEILGHELVQVNDVRAVPKPVSYDPNKKTVSEILSDYFDKLMK